MANEEFSLDIALQITPQSLKNIQGDINNAIRQINPELKVDLEGLTKFAREGVTLPVNLGAIKSGALKELRQSIEEALDIRISKITPTANARKELKKELQNALDELNVLKGTQTRIAGKFASSANVMGSAAQENQTPDEKSKKVADAQEKLVSVINQLIDVSERDAKLEEQARKEEIDSYRLLARHNEADAKELEAARKEEANSYRFLANFNKAEAKEIEAARKEEVDSYKLLARFNEEEAKLTESAQQEERNAYKLLARFLEKEAKIEADAINKEEAARQEIRDAYKLLAKFTKEEQKEVEAARKEEADSYRLLANFNEATAKEEEAARKEEISAYKLLARHVEAEAKEEEAARKEQNDAYRLLAGFLKEEARIVAIQDKESQAAAESVVKSLEEEAALRSTLIEDELRVKRALIDASGKVAQEYETLAAVISEQAKNGGLTSSSGKPLSIQKPNLGPASRELSNFAAQLDPKSLENFAGALQGVAKGTKSASELFGLFNANIKTSTSFTDKLRDSLNSGTKSAFEFGQKAQEAAGRLLAWAAPASFIFGTISALKNATNELVALDAQARRLTFFQGTTLDQLNKLNTKGGIGINFGEISQQARQASSNIDLFVKTSRDLGVSLGDVTEAIISTSRVGQKLQDTIKNVDGTTVKVRSAFLDTVLSLVRLEGGALKAEDAVNSLNAIDVQFFSKLRGQIDGVNLTLDDFSKGISSAGALLASVASEAAFDVKELADATARVGAAFANIQGTGLPQVIELIGKASSATGANVGRLSTALRQILTFSVQNADKIKSQFNLDVIDESGGVKGFDAVLDILRKINELSGSEKGVDLAKLIGDRRNVADIQSLAVAVDTLDKEFGRLGDTQAEVNITRAATEKQALQDVLAFNSLQASTNKLNTEIVALARDANLQDLFRAATDGATSLAVAAQGTLDILSKFGPVLTLISNFALNKIAPKIAAGIAGFVNSAIGQATGSTLKNSLVIDAKNQEIALTKTLNEAEKEGLVTRAEARALSIEEVKLFEAQYNLQNKLKIAEVELAALQKNRIQNLVEIETIEEEIALIKENQVKTELKQNALRGKGAGAIQAANGLATASKGTAIALVAAVGATLADTFADSFSKKLSHNDVIAAGISSAIKNTATGASIGAAIGSIVPVLGTALGAVIGGIVGLGGTLLQAAFGDIASEVSGQLEEQTQRLEARRKALLAGHAARELADARKAQELGQKDDRAKAQERLNTLKDEELDIERQLQATDIDEGKRDDLKKKGFELLKEILLGNLDLEKEENKEAKQRIDFEDRLNRIKQEELSTLNEMENLEKTLTDFVEARSKVGLTLKFNKAQTEREIKTLLDRVQTISEQRDFAIKFNAPIEEITKFTRDIEEIGSEINAKREEQRGKEIDAQNQLIDLSTRKAQEQITAWQEAAKAVADAFSKVADDERNIASNFFDAGKRVSDQLNAVFQDSAQLLSSAGAGLDERLRRAADVADRRLRAIQGGTSKALQEIRRGPITPFGSPQEIQRDLDRLTNLIAEAGARGQQKIVDDETKIINTRLANLRVEEQNETTVFQLRLSQTKAELDLRKRLGDEEISILRSREELERQLNNERIAKQREFGRLILQGPQEFLAVANDIKTARDFFKGINNLDASSIKDIFARAANAVGNNEFSALQSVLRGLESAQKVGAPSVAGGISNQQLQNIFENVLDPFNTPDQLIADVKRQADEINNQTSIQKEIDARQKEQAAILDAEEKLQQAQLTLDSVAQDTAIKQRDALINLMQESVKQQRADLAALKDLQDVAVFALRIAPQNQGAAAQSSIDDLVNQIKLTQDTAAAVALQNQLNPLGSAITSTTSNFTTSINNASTAVNNFNQQLKTIDDLRNQVQQNVETAATGPNTNAQNSISGNAGDAIKRIEEVVRRTVNGGIAIQHSREFEELRRTIERTGGSPQQLARFNELKNTEASPQNFGSTQFSQVARALFTDPSIKNGLTEGLRSLFQSGAGGESELVRQLRDARGSGTRGAQTIDPETIKEILGQVGLSGLGRDVNTRGEAVQLVDKLLRFSDELNRTPDRLSERATGIIRDILTTELREGFRNINEVLNAREIPRNQHEQQAGQAAPTNLNIFNNDDIERFADQFASSVNTKLGDGFIVVGDQLREVITTSIQGAKLTISVPDFAIALNGQITNEINGDAFLAQLTDVLTDHGISKDQIAILRGRLAQILNVMVNNGQIPPEK